MGSDRDTLLSFGFEPARVDWALKATNNRGLQPAMDFLVENENNAVPNLDDVSATSSAGAAGGASGAGDNMDEDDEDVEALKAIYGESGKGGSSEDANPKSIKCSICGKIFRNTAFANYHAEKSGHDQFEESTEELKPLTEEEKKEKIAELRAKAAAKKAKSEAEENKKNEAIRRKHGKDLGAIREDLKVKEAMKEAEQRRKEKIEDAKARAAIKAKIEADKRERAERTAREKALREGKQPPQSQNTGPSNLGPAAAAAATAGASKDYAQTRLQIRLASGGQPYITTLSSDAPLREVAEYLAGQTLAVDVETVTFAQHFPRKQFTQADFSKTLRELGLTPSAVLIAS
ncbi:hypothetical protein M422DRAFT_34931 [Sphaerobolus stellatus SS14]|uniref:UBX domain-containing protein n=1 Tax=Sphaerobolus stellatus (strain SS14) TaxID=990650 RepID=A0A0C9UZT8_SPHS4|nr:hypothetical protein M422DRAFT_34931 [Sphaerobolus stellatus SS14]